VELLKRFWLQLRQPRSRGCTWRRYIACNSSQASDYFSKKDGTSLAAPHVAAILAMMMQCEQESEQENGGLHDHGKLLEKLYDSSENHPIYNSLQKAVRYGKVNAALALKTLI
jgi:hypothetical protein